MHFGHEQLDVYRVSMRYVAWPYEVAKRLEALIRVFNLAGFMQFPAPLKPCRPKLDISRVSV